jgi:phosphoenolpyruvate carboxykinase (GTP)
LNVGKKLRHPPKIFHVNWFRADEQGKFLWPGFGENIRVIDWIVRRTRGDAATRTTPIGLVPDPAALNLSGLDISGERLAQLLEVDWSAWTEECARAGDFFGKFEERLPPALNMERAALLARLTSARA